MNEEIAKNEVLETPENVSEGQQTVENEGRKESTPTVEDKLKTLEEELRQKTKEIHSLKSQLGNTNKNLTSKEKSEETLKGEVEELKQQLETLKNETTLEKLNSNKLKLINESQIPSDFVDYITVTLEDTEDTLKEKVTSLKNKLEGFKNELLQSFNVTQFSGTKGIKGQPKTKESTFYSSLMEQATTSEKIF